MMTMISVQRPAFLLFMPCFHVHFQNDHSSKARKLSIFQVCLFLFSNLGPESMPGPPVVPFLPSSFQTRVTSLAFTNLYQQDFHTLPPDSKNHVTVFTVLFFLAFPCFPVISLSSLSFFDFFRLHHCSAVVVVMQTGTSFDSAGVF